MGKAFDRLIECREYVPERLRKYLKQARLFEYDIFPTESLDTVDITNREVMDRLVESFSLPFKVVAIEDKAGVVIFTSEGDPDPARIDVRREVIIGHFNREGPEYYKENESDEEYLRGSKESLHKNKDWFDGSFSVMVGGFVTRWDGDVRKWATSEQYALRAGLWRADGTYAWSADFENGVADGFDTEDLELLRPHCERDIVRAGITAYEELLPLGNHEKVILEVTRKQHPKDKPPKYRKTCHRPVYTLVKPNEARKVMGLPEPIPKTEGGRIIVERRAHWRAAHERTLKAEKWGESRGKVIQVDRTWVTAFWNGERTAEREGHYYKVILGDEK